MSVNLKYDKMTLVLAEILMTIMHIFKKNTMYKKKYYYPQIEIIPINFLKIFYLFDNYIF